VSYGYLIGGLEALYLQLELVCDLHTMVALWYTAIEDSSS
jgi:hypothetical protein